LDPKTRGVSVPADLIRTLAIVLVILLHAAIEQFSINNEVSQGVLVRWWAVDFYDSIARVCVPLFVMLSGALLLQPYKVEEPVHVFLKKRFVRIGLPLLFWGSAYFAWRYFANNEVFTLTSIGQGILSGPYYHFWFLYMIIGLYLVTPLLRVLVAHAERQVLRYFLLLWFIGSAAIPVINLFVTYSLVSNFFLVTGWIGYFMLGLYLLDTRVRPRTLYVALFSGFAWTIIGTYLITFFVGGQLQYFFYNFLGINVILASTALFLLLNTIPTDYVKKKSFSTNRLIHFIGQSSLAIYLMHVIVLESLHRGFFGVQISITTINPILEIPLATAITFFICLILLYPASKIPLLKKIIGINS
jgi:surface polysaccharide O-acyltransferase-like enzyme